MRPGDKRDLPTSTTTRFKVGSRVVRRENVFDDTSPVMHGSVARVYEHKATHKLPSGAYDFYPEVYTVRWDSGKEHDGFLPHGLELEEAEWSRQ